jgi:hypothetical protein
MKRFQVALNVQSAVNPTGVAHAFLNACSAFRDTPECTGTESIKNDPALRLIVYQLAYLMGASDMPLIEYQKLVHHCEDIQVQPVE